MLGQLKLPENLVLTDQFKEALDLMENTNENIFLTGKAGTGKSTLLQLFRDNTEKHPVVLAPTGIAAINVGGETIHSFFGFPARYMPPDELHIRKWDWEFGYSLRTIVIDEVSMVRADMMDNIDKFLRLNIKPKFEGDEPMAKPFGGVQMILIGDIYQLSPVVEKDLEPLLAKQYTTDYFFSANIWDEAELKRIELEHIFRQTDKDFIGVLNNIRSGVCGPPDLQFLNRRFNPMQAKKEEDIVYLVTTNSKAASINQKELDKLRNHEEKTFSAVINGNIDGRSYPTDAELRLRVGAQIMMLRNDPQGRWVNGTVGKVYDFLIPYSEEYDGPEMVKTKDLGEHVLPGLRVEIDGEIYDVDLASWGKVKYEAVLDEKGNPTPEITYSTTGQFIQVPVKLAWAITIHKSQGQTFDKAIIDFGFGTFAHGQAYVALSRCRSVQGMYLTRPMNKKDVKLDTVVRDWMEGA